VVHSSETARVEKEVGGFLHVPGKYGPGTRQDRMYGSEYSDNPLVKYKENNQANKVPEILKRRAGKVDHAIWGESITDITNLKQQYLAALNQPNTGVFCNEDLARVYEAAGRSSIASILVAEKALETNPQLKKIIITDRPARYDDLYELNELSNFVLRSRALQSKYRGRLVVGEHSLHCHGARREARYGRPGATKGYDGVHFRTVEGKRAYTNSLIRILQKEGVSSVEEEEEWQVASGRRAARRREAEDSRPSVTTSNRYNNFN
jgi:hypothetical protein